MGLEKSLAFSEGLFAHEHKFSLRNIDFHLSNTSSYRNVLLDLYEDDKRFRKS